MASDRAVLKGKSGSQHKKKVRRGERRKTKQCIDSRTCKFLYVNINGYKSKADSIQQLIEEQRADIVLLTETKVYAESAINIKGFQTFSAVRDKNKGGGPCVGIRHGLYRSVMVDSGDNAQFITVQLNVTNKTYSTRLILAYGPQENEADDVKDLFYQNLSLQIEKALISGSNVILAGDINAKLGPKIIALDQCDMSANGKRLYDVYTKYDLLPLNSLEICSGVFTRVHHNNGKIEKSVLDYVFVNSGLRPNVKSIYIDEEKLITPWRKVTGGKKKFTDHCAIRFEVDLHCYAKKYLTRTKVWNFKNPEGWDKFCQMTKSSDEFKKPFDMDEHVEISYQNWKKKLNSILHACFKKKRIVPNRRPYNAEIRSLLKERKVVKRKLQASKNSYLYRCMIAKMHKLDRKIEHKIADFNSFIIRQKVDKNGTIDKQNFWKLKRALAPKCNETVHSLRSSDGNDISDPINIKSEYRKEFQYRLRKRNIKHELKSYENFQNSICQLRLSASQKNISPDFTLSELKFAVKQFKNGKCMDPIGHIREIFKYSGDGFLISLLCIINKIKGSRILPLEWSKVWMKTLKKKKGSPKILNSYRGVFIVPILSIILEKLIKNRIMNTLRNNISQFQNGGMKGKGVVDNLFIIRGVIDHALYLGKELCITFFDIEKCFDSL